MGRLSRILKAVSDKPKDPAEGVSSRSGSGLLKTPDPQLTRLVACWPLIPDHFKKTILFLVEAAEAQSKQAADGAPGGS